MLEFKFLNGSIAIVKNTSDPSIENKLVIITGIHNVNPLTKDAYFTVEKATGEEFLTKEGNWKTIVLHQDCLFPI